MTRNRKTKKDLIADELKLLIGSGELPRGTRIQQDELAARFDTSITPVREAMRQLEAQGLLVSEPHRGVRVAEANLDEVKGVYVARRLLEPYAAQRASLRVSRRDLDRADELIEAMGKARKKKDYAEARCGQSRVSLPLLRPVRHTRPHADHRRALALLPLGHPPGDLGPARRVDRRAQRDGRGGSRRRRRPREDRLRGAHQAQLPQPGCPSHRRGSGRSIRSRGRLTADREG